MKSQFRTNWIRRLKAEGQKLLAPITSIEQCLQVPKMQRRYTEINSILESIGATKLHSLHIPVMVELPIMLSYQNELNIRESIKDQGALDRAAWKFIASTETYVVSHVYSKSKRNNGRWVTVQKADHTIGYQSFGTILANGKKWQTLTLGKVARYEVPEGYTLKKGLLGLKLVRDSDGSDYHPSRAELLIGCPEEWAAQIVMLDSIRTKAEEQKKQRERHRQLFYADAKTTRVHMQDSKSVGNCAAGTIAFGERLGVALSEYHGINTPGVSGALLLRTKDPKAEAAVWAAWERETLVCI